MIRRDPAELVVRGVRPDTAEECPDLHFFKYARSSDGFSSSESSTGQRLPRSPWKLGDGGPGVIVTQ
jgi:hypothetical protein